MMCSCVNATNVPKVYTHVSMLLTCPKYMHVSNVPKVYACINATVKEILTITEQIKYLNKYLNNIGERNVYFTLLFELINDRN